MSKKRYPFDEMFFECEISSCNANELGRYCQDILRRRTRPVDLIPAIRSIGLIKDGRKISFLMQLLSATQPDIVCETINALGNLRAFRAEAKLRELYTSENPHIRQQVSLALNKILGKTTYAYRAPKVFPQVQQRVARQASAYLARIPKEQLLPKIMAAVTHPSDAHEPYDIVCGLEHLADPIHITALRWIAENASEALLAMYASIALGKMGLEYPLSPFIACLNTVTLWLPDEAIDAAVELHDARLVPFLVRALTHQRVIIREMAADALMALTDVDYGWDWACWRFYLRKLSTGELLGHTDDVFYKHQ